MSQKSIEYDKMESIDSLNFNNFKFNSISHAINFYLLNCKNISNIDEKIEINTIEQPIWKGKDVYSALVRAFKHFSKKISKQNLEVFVETEINKLSVRQVARDRNKSRNYIQKIINQNKVQLEQELKRYDLI